MEREFIILSSFERDWEECGFTDDDLGRLEISLCQDPEQGVVIPGTGGIRKLRWGLKQRGKRGGIRIIYIDFIVDKEIYFLAAYQKNIKKDLTEEERRNMRHVAEYLKAEKERKRRK